MYVPQLYSARICMIHSICSDIIPSSAACFLSNIVTFTHISHTYQYMCTYIQMLEIVIIRFWMRLFASNTEICSCYPISRGRRFQSAKSNRTYTCDIVATRVWCWHQQAAGQPGRHVPGISLDGPDAVYGPCGRSHRLQLSLLNPRRVRRPPRINNRRGVTRPCLSNPAINSYT